MATFSPSWTQIPLFMIFPAFFVGLLPGNFGQNPLTFPRSWAHFPLHGHNFFFSWFSRLFCRVPPSRFGQKSLLFPFKGTRCFFGDFRAFSYHSVNASVHTSDPAPLVILYDCVIFCPGQRGSYTKEKLPDLLGLVAFESLHFTGFSNVDDLMAFYLARFLWFLMVPQESIQEPLFSKYVTHERMIIQPSWVSRIIHQIKSTNVSLGYILRKVTEVGFIIVILNYAD